MHIIKKYQKEFLFTTIIIATLTAIFWLVKQPFQIQTDTFSGERALEDVAYQLSLGPRTPGSAAHAEEVEWIQDELTRSGWAVELQETIVSGVVVRNIIAKRGQGVPWIILGAHYDSRIEADQDSDPNRRKMPVPGANDGASGIAVLLELARIIPADLDKQVWLVFFDAEDNGSYDGRGWIIGSRAFVDELIGKPDAVVIVDMIGDADLNIYKEKNSNPELTNEIWEIASGLGYGQFIPEYKYRMTDDHTPFLEANIAAIDIIDFDYPYWHTTQDTLDKVSAESMQAIGDTLLAWILR